MIKASKGSKQAQQAQHEQHSVRMLAANLDLAARYSINLLNCKWFYILAQGKMSVLCSVTDLVHSEDKSCVSQATCFCLSSAVAVLCPDSCQLYLGKLLAQSGRPQTSCRFHFHTDAALNIDSIFPQTDGSHGQQISVTALFGKSDGSYSQQK